MTAGVDWSTFEIGRWWPLWAGAAAVAAWVAVWVRPRGVLFPDMSLLARTAAAGGMVDRLPIVVGVIIAGSLLFVLMQPSVARSVIVEERARDFLFVVDTSRSMRKDTGLSRQVFRPTYERRVGLFSGFVEDPSTITELARYEIARESLVDFLAVRQPHDRIGLIYFHSEVMVMAGLTSQLTFVEQQLAGMDEHVRLGTNLRWATEVALDLLERYPRRGRRAVVLLTDAEVRYTRDLEAELARIRDADVDFYLLWITTDEPDQVTDAARSFLALTRSLGQVYLIDSLDERNLQEALVDIDRLESYSHVDVRQHRVDLGEPVLRAVRWVILLWVFLVSTTHHPIRRHRVFDAS
jgi:Mg-chelatase subunit ChlD